MSRITIEEFIRADHEGHLGYSAGELMLHGNRENDLTNEVRREYFYGISTVFPLMLLGHYHEWRTGKEPSVYMEEFVPSEQEKLRPITGALLDTIYELSGSDTAWAAAVGSYLAAVPYRILRDYAAWTELAEPERVDAFVRAEQENELPGLIRRLSGCNGNAARVETIRYLGGDYPFELLERFHKAVIE